MVDKEITSEKQLDVLHDHFKETFSRQREMERSRDRHFLWVIVLFAVLAVEIAYPVEFSDSVREVSLLGVQIDFTALPMAALLNATWTLTLAIILRYCQVSVFIDRQYSYIHTLEKKISPLVGGGDLYQREGEVYLRGYPLLFNVAFYAYTVMFPLILITATASLWAWESNQLSIPWWHRFADLLLAIVIIATLFLYRMQPYLTSKVHCLRNRLRPISH